MQVGSCQTVQKPKKYDNPDATANAAISARLPYLMATARFSHYLKIMARDKIGSFMERADCEDDDAADPVGRGARVHEVGHRILIEVVHHLRDAIDAEFRFRCLRPAGRWPRPEAACTATPALPEARQAPSR